MEDYTVVVEGEVVKKPEKPQLIDFAKMPRKIIHKKYNHHACCKR